MRVTLQVYKREIGIDGSANVDEEKEGVSWNGSADLRTERRNKWW